MHLDTTNAQALFMKARSLENEGPTHFLPRDPCEDSLVRPDLFTLGLASYELEHGNAPFHDVDDETVSERFTLGIFPSVSHLRLECLNSGSWENRCDKATGMLRLGDLI